MSKSLPKYLIGIDTETSGTNIPGEICPNEVPSQCLSIALIVLDTHRLALPEVASFKGEMRFDDSQFDWSEQAEKIHGLTREYLADAPTIAQVAGLIVPFINYFIPADERVILLGHNPSFDRAFLLQVLQAGGQQLKLHHRMVDGFSLGFGYYGLQNSDEQLAFFGQSREYHNPLDDIRQTAEMLRAVRRGGDRELKSN